MPFPVACGCGRRFMAQDYLLGRRVPCPECGTSLLIQNRNAAAAAPQPTQMIHVVCTCGRTYQPGPELAGRTVRCTACSNVLQIPSPHGAVPLEQEAIPSLPARTVYPSAMKRPARPTRQKVTRSAAESDQRTFRIVLGIAIAVSSLAIFGGLGYGVVLPLARHIAQRADDDTTADSSDAITGNEMTGNEVTGEDANNESDSTLDATDAMASIESDQNEDSDLVADTAAYGPQVADTANPFERSSYSDMEEDYAIEMDAAEVDVAGMDLAEMGATEYASSFGDGRLAAKRDSRRSDVAAVSPAVQDSADALDLVASLNVWHSEPNRDRMGIRRIGGDNLAVYAHYSWLTELLPHLGHQSVYDKFDFSESWLDDDNLQLSGELIPQFQNPSDQRQRWKGYPFDQMALTHFVGMSGIEDRRNVVAAKLPRDDPRAGIFGYDDVAQRDEITDGESNTIMLIGGGKLASPWVAGGGATVRGAREPYFDGLTGFGSQGGSRKGAISVMADGSVKFISSDIDPAAFRAMSTIHGSDSVDVSRWISDTSLTK
jgi:DNA-directed RNA polymerase subunit RPC12/RpoP